MSSEKETENVAGADAAVAAWFGERLPSEWTATAPKVTVDREEIIVILAVPAPESTTPESATSESATPESTTSESATAEPGSPEASDDAAKAARAEAVAGRIARFREETREHRIAIAREAEHRFGRKVAWGVRSGDTQQVFTSLAIPVMTRLRQAERLVLDTLVDAGVARSRAHGLAWCVRLVGDNASTWLTDLRSAMAEVEKVRDAGPGTSAK
jgi:hypothetical protein